MATIIFVLAMAVTLFGAIQLQGSTQKLVCLVGIIVQAMAYFWYNLTFIPFGRRIFKAMFKGCCKKCFED